MFCFIRQKISVSLALLSVLSAGLFLSVPAIGHAACGYGCASYYHDNYDNTDDCNFCEPPDPCESCCEDAIRPSCYKKHESCCEKRCEKRSEKQCSCRNCSCMKKNYLNKSCDCLNVKMRYERGCHDKKCKAYRSGCRAAKTYVEDKSIGEHSKEWNQGFTDCRFNVYRSSRTEREAEKSICGYSPCCR